MKYIRDTYGVPAKRGGRVKYQDPDKPYKVWFCTITSAQNGYLRLRRDGDIKTYPAPFHPEWGLTYLMPNNEIQTGKASRFKPNPTTLIINAKDTVPCPVEEDLPRR